MHHIEQSGSTFFHYVNCFWQVLKRFLAKLASYQAQNGLPPMRLPPEFDGVVDAEGGDDDEDDVELDELTPNVTDVTKPLDNPLPLFTYWTFISVAAPPPAYIPSPLFNNRVPVLLL